MASKKLRIKVISNSRLIISNVLVLLEPNVNMVYNSPFLRRNESAINSPKITIAAVPAKTNTILKICLILKIFCKRLLITSSGITICLVNPSFSNLPLNRVDDL